MLQGGMHPGKLNPNHSSLYIAYGGQEIPMQEYEILVQVQRYMLMCAFDVQTFFRGFKGGAKTPFF